MNEAATHFGWFWWTAAAVSFLLGSTPFGVLIARSKGVDIRAVGSGNPGAIVLPVMVFVMAVLPGTPSASLAGSIPFLVVTLAVAGLIVFRHRSNLAGLSAARRAADPNREG